LIAVKDKRTHVLDQEKSGAPAEAIFAPHKKKKEKAIDLTF